MDGIVLRYVGDGAFVAGVPTRDLSEQDVAECGKTIEELMGSGLYVTPTPEPGIAPGTYGLPRARKARAQGREIDPKEEDREGE